MQNDDKADIFIVFPECGKYSLVMRYVFLCCCIADCSENVTIIKKKKIVLQESFLLATSTERVDAV